MTKPMVPRAKPSPAIMLRGVIANISQEIPCDQAQNYDCDDEAGCTDDDAKEESCDEVSAIAIELSWASSIASLVDRAIGAAARVAAI
jgi:hypothetical protein